jgi:hypothetical protein
VLPASITVALGGAWTRLAAPAVLADASGIDCARRIASRPHSLAESRRYFRR